MQTGSPTQQSPPPFLVCCLGQTTATHNSVNCLGQNGAQFWWRPAPERCEEVVLSNLCCMITEGDTVEMYRYVAM